MNERNQGRYKLFSVVAAVGLVLWGALASGQDNASAFAKNQWGQGMGTNADVRQLTSPKPAASTEHSSRAGQPNSGLFAVPGPAQPVVSTALGREDVRYQVRRVGGALSADNPAQSLRVEFTPRGLELRAGRTRWRLVLAGYGYGGAVQRPRAAAPQARANRVEYDRGPLVEWYANGPLGLEQGFTLNEPPGRHTSKHKSEPLTIALTLGGDLSASADSPAKRPGDAAGNLTLRDGNGRAVLRYTGLAAHDASGQDLLAWLELDGEELRLCVDDAKARYPVVVDPFVQQAKLTESDGMANDLLGASVAVSSDGSTIVAGAPKASIGIYSVGAVYVFVKPSSGWTSETQAVKLTASDGKNGDSLGYSVSISGDGSTVAAGAPAGGLYDATGGAVYVFVKPSTGWPTTTTETAKLTASDAKEFDFLGGSVSISGDGSTVAAGATIKLPQGAAYVFVKPSSGWASETEAAKLTAADAATNLGNSVGISGDGGTVAAGAYFATIGSNSEQGAAYVFVKPSTGWTSETAAAKLTASDGAAGDSLGYSVGVSGDGSTIAAGARFATIGSNSMQGAAYVFVKPSSGWISGTQTAKLTATDGAANDLLGFSLGIGGDGTRIVAGALNNSSQGAAYVFDKPSAAWMDTTQTTKLTASDGATGDEFGFSTGVSSDGSTMVAGALQATIGSNSMQGAAYTFLAAPSANLAPAGLSFAAQPVGTTSSAQTVTLTNNGNGPLHVTGVEAASGFSTTANCVTASPVAAGATCTESVAFIPTSTGPLTGSLTFTDDSNGTTGSTQSVSLSGIGVKATTTTSISVMPSPSVVGEAVTVSLSVSPQGGNTPTPTGTVTVSASTGESCLGSAPSGSCTLTFLTAMPRTIIASYGGDANFVGSTSAGVAQTVQDFTLAAGPASETISSGHKATYSLTLTAIDGLSGSVSLACSGGPPNSTCMISPNPVSLSGSANATVSVTGTNSMKHGTFTLTFTGIFGSGNPVTGGLTRNAGVSLTVK